jgi:hypothetical protein
MSSIACALEQNDTHTHMMVCVFHVLTSSLRSSVSKKGDPAHKTQKHVRKSIDLQPTTHQAQKEVWQPNQSNTASIKGLSFQQCGGGELQQQSNPSSIQLLASARAQRQRKRVATFQPKAPLCLPQDGRSLDAFVDKSCCSTNRRISNTSSLW